MSEPEEKLQGEQRDSTKKKKKEKRSGKKKKKEKKEQEEEQQVEEDDERWVLALRFLQVKVPHRTTKELSDWLIGSQQTDESDENTFTTYNVKRILQCYISGILNHRSI